MTVTLGRDLLFQLLREYGVSHVFGNPGTSELPFIDGFPKYADVEYVTALHEANAVGMAMGYARQADKPGVVILHVAPGLANGMGNLYNAYRAGIPLVVIAGQHHTRLLLEEPILAGDHVGQVRSMTKWAHEVRYAEELPLALHRAFKVAMTPPRGPVFLSIPYDISIAPAAVDRLAPPTRVASGFCAERAALEEIAKELLRAKRPLILAGDGVGDAGAHLELQRLAERIGAGVMSEGMPTRQNADNRHRCFLGTLPMNAGQIRRILSEYDLLFYVGVKSQAPVALYDNGGSFVKPGTTMLYLHDDPWEIGKNVAGGIGAWGALKASLAALADLVIDCADFDQEQVRQRLREVEAKARARREQLEQALDADRQSGAITAKIVAAELANLLPKDGKFTIVNEAVSNALPFIDHIHLWEPKQYTAGKGGGLGHGAAQAVGTAIADPERTVVSLLGDGTFLYYPQILYSAVKTNARVLFIVVNNRAYHVLKTGLKALGAPLGGDKLDCLDLDGPADLIRMAEAFGVPAERVTAVESLPGALKTGLQAQGPYFLDISVTT
ncbi:acetolactate synthase catalytic subunit [Paenibacillus sp. 32O-W]|uniref:thiamine pyrophosphate-binding protein n=1 Tax=Paenibacillus sp. 32O-W TaxID=1695218 RepID=UPI000721BCE3|nr:thiamine pyrophosphate-binding protein [Paenibacillus sp. 32O-W]ALS26429.1 acetolactate synthase catalytic subunit [Paenibacillus sp. 32O-W]